MNTFEPRQVSPHAWKEWLKEALRIQTRAWISSLFLTSVITFVMMSLFYFLHWFICLLLMLVIAPYLIAVFMINTFRVEGYDVKALFSVLKLRAWLRLLIAGVVGWTVFFLVVGLLIGIVLIIVSLLMGDGFSFAQQNRWLDDLMYQVPTHGLNYPLLFFSALLFITFPIVAFYAQSLFPKMSIWFLVPLVLLFDVKLIYAYRLSNRAELLNGLSINSVTLLGIVLMLSVLVSGGILALVLLPLLGVLHYVSFREVFFNNFERHLKLSETTRAKISYAKQSSLNTVND